MTKYLKQLEGMIEGWLKKVPHLPKGGQKWLAENVWWIALIGAIAYGISVLVSLSTLAYLSSTAYALYLVPGFGAWSTILTVVNLIFYVVLALLLALSIKPLKDMTKKGWTLLFMVLLVDIVALVIGSLLSFIQGISFSGTGVFAFTGLIFSLIFGGIFAAAVAYFLFEIRSHFAHVSKGAAKKN